MNRKIKVGVTFGVMILVPVLTGLDMTIAYSNLITDLDRAVEIQQRVNGTPALSSGLHEEVQWESYNQWLCFPTRQAEILFIEVDYNGLHLVPSLSASSDGHHFVFDLAPDVRWDCDAIRIEWEQLMAGSDEFCVFAAYLQSIEDDVSLWSIDRLKTRNGYWYAPGAK